jgi:hypothetical protein
MQMTDEQLIEYALRITALVNAPEHMTVQAAAAVVEAAMFGCTEGTVRAEQQACIDGKVRAEQQARIDKGDAHA